MTLEPILARELCPRKGLLTVLTGLLLASPWAVAQQGREDPADSQPFRIDVNLVTLRFTVTDTRGDFANSLSAEDFVVEENGKPVEIEIFEKPRDQSAVSSDLWLAFLIDVSGSTFATRTEEIVAAQTFLDNLTPATRIGVFGFTEELLPFQTFTSDRNLVLKAIGQARRHLGKTAIYASLDRLVSLTSGTAPAGSPKAVILISDGLDPSHGEAKDSARRALEAGFAVYTIRVPSSAQVYIGPNPNPKEKSLQNSRRQRNEKQIKAFQQLAPLTGGRSFSGFETILDFDNTLAEINDHLFGNLYRVGYYRDSSLGPNVLERVQVRPRRGDLRIASAFKKLPRQFDAKRSLLRVFFDTSGESTVHGLAPVRFQELGADMDVLRQISEGSLVGAALQAQGESLLLSRGDERWRTDATRSSGPSSRPAGQGGCAAQRNHTNHDGCTGGQKRSRNYLQQSTAGTPRGLYSAGGAAGTLHLAADFLHPCSHHPRRRIVRPDKASPESSEY